MISEKTLHNLILEDIESFVRELGNCFCFIVVELKATELKKEHIGQIQVYMNVSLDYNSNFLI